jgi:cytochrome c553
MFKARSILLFLVTVLNSVTMAEGDVARGKEKASVCAACHGADGNSTNPIWPKIAGQQPYYIVKQLKAFKLGASKGGRDNPLMAPIVANLSDQDMEDLAAYFAAQPRTLYNSKPEDVKKGEGLYRGGDMERKIPACIACHGPQGLGVNGAAFPALSGQHPEYTVASLLAYQNGSRKLAPIMETIVTRMNKADMEDVAKYVSVLH